jgi:putative spermidine/putrescine transport system ATP-binding protein
MTTPVVSVAVTPSRDASRDGRYLEIAGVSKRFDDSVVLAALDATVARGEFVSLLGPSGCGKTTLLRIIAGLLAPDQGVVSIDGRDLTRVPAHRRNIGVVFQNYALFPHLDVSGNLAFGLEAQGVPKAHIGPRVAEALALVRMQAFADRRISALSGGQQQRIAVARALVVQPSVLLLDEPFSALDRNLRETMQIELRDLLRRQNITSIFVTHDQEEALVMSDRIAVMNAGRIEHFGPPDEIYRRPRSLFAMEFVGQSLRMSGIVRGHERGVVAVETALGIIRGPGTFVQGTRAVVAVRPELVDLDADPAEGVNALTLEVADTVYLGSKTMIWFRTPAEGDRALAEVARMATPPTPGERRRIGWSVADTMVFPCP